MSQQSRRTHFSRSSITTPNQALDQSRGLVGKMDALTRRGWSPRSFCLTFSCRIARCSKHSKVTITPARFSQGLSILTWQ